MDQVIHQVLDQVIHQDLFQVVHQVIHQVLYQVLYQVMYQTLYLVRTSLHSVPKSFILASASSLRLPCSTPLVTRGMGMSLWTL